MSLSPLSAEWPSAYEQETGRKPTEISIRIAEHIDRIGEQLTTQGKEDSSNHHAPMTFDRMLLLAHETFPNESASLPEFAQAVARTWECDYLEGFRGGGRI